MNKLVIIDFSNLAYKCFYGIKAPLKCPQGRPTNAIHGFWHSFFKIIDEFNPSHLVICMEGKDRVNNPRRLLYPQYKANRNSPEDIKWQLEELEQQLASTDIPILRIEPYEADDTIASVMKQGKDYFTEIAVISVDKDLLQFVTNSIYLIDISALNKMDDKFVFNKYGIYPNQILDFLSITGDSADNIPGVPGVGPKGAQKFLTQHSLDSFFETEPIVTDKTFIKIKENKNAVLLAKKLVSIYDELKLPEWDKMKFSFKPTYELKDKLEALNLKSVLDRLFYFEDDEQEEKEEP